MINMESIYSEAIEDYVENFRQNKMKFKILVVPSEENLKSLPKEAFTASMILNIDFDFEAKETWITDQIFFEDNTFNCVLVYKVNNEWVEYKTKIPCANIISITKKNKVRSTLFKVTKHNKEFQIKVDNSKRSFKNLNGKLI